MKKIILFFLPLVLCTGIASAQVKTNYAPGRDELAEKTFKELVDLCTGSNALNLASDYADAMKAIEEYPELKTAVLENILFDYCKVPDSFKTEENKRAAELDGKSWYTLRERPEWNTLGEKYIKQRQEIENKKIE